MVVAGKDALCCAITDLGTHRLDPSHPHTMRLRQQVRQWAVDGVDIVQLREKQLESGELFQLAEIAVSEIRGVATAQGRPRVTKLLVNGRADVAAAAGADGVHLTARPDELTVSQARQVFAAAGLAHCLVSVSCHTEAEVVSATHAGADLVLFGPVFEKWVAGQLAVPGRGLDALHSACIAAGSTPVLALGGITHDTVEACLGAGAAGVSGIRLFQDSAAGREVL